MKSAPPLRLACAAEYVQMSTNISKDSIANQRMVIREYAADRNMTICRTYSDAGRTGLTLRHRRTLAQLFIPRFEPHRERAAILPSGEGSADSSGAQNATCDEEHECAERRG